MINIIEMVNDVSTETMQPQPFSSAGADLINGMEKELGAKYTNRLLHTTTFKSNKYRVYQSLDFRVNAKGSTSWGKAMTVTSLITGVLGLTATTALVKAICGVFGIAASAGSIIPAGKLNKYDCIGMEYRTVTINGSKYVYNSTDKFTSYKGYENASNSSKERAYIDTSSKKIDYLEGKTYYNSYTSQINDAYIMFQRIGQMA